MTDRTPEAQRMPGRRKPYTDRGISRVPCARCGKPSRYQWSVCALGGNYNGVCPDCDVLLNAAMLEFFRIPKRSAIRKRYERRVRHD